MNCTVNDSSMFNSTTFSRVIYHHNMVILFSVKLHLLTSLAGFAKNKRSFYFFGETTIDMKPLVLFWLNK